MKKKLIFGSMLAVLLVLSLAAIGCKNDPEEGGANIPPAYQNTTWTSNKGDKIEFTTDSVKVTPNGKAGKEFKCESIGTTIMDGGSVEEPQIHFGSKSSYGGAHINVKADGTKLISCTFYLDDDTEFLTALAETLTWTKQ